jgi:hypothetical protein
VQNILKIVSPNKKYYQSSQKLTTSYKSPGLSRARKLNYQETRELEALPGKIDILEKNSECHLRLNESCLS